MSREVELRLGHDVLDARLMGALMADIRRGFVLGAMLALPCTTFSIARSSNSQLRSMEFPDGLPTLEGRWLAQAQLGNALLTATLKIIRALDATRTPWILENPNSSYAFKTSQWLAYEAKAANTYTVKLDQCQYGARWRKRTKLAIGNIDPRDVTRLCRCCRARRGICSRTGKAHWHLQGSLPGGGSATAAAAEYPKPLATSLAFVLALEARLMCDNA